MEYEKFKHQVQLLSALSEAQTDRVIVAVLQELHDRLSPREADDLAAQLPGELKAMWHAFDAPGRGVRRTHKAEFVRHVAETAEVPEDVASHAVMAVFKGVQLLLHSPTGQEGEAWDVFSQLPKDLKRVWTAASRMQVKPGQRKAKVITVTCPKCRDGDVQISPHSVSLGEAHPTWRHFHGHCRACGSQLWWAGPPGMDHPSPQIGAHNCPFFTPTSV